MNLQLATRRLNLRPDWVINNILLVALILMCVYFTSQNGSFLTLDNAMNVLENNATLGIVAVALTLLVISGGVDLSIGSTVALSGLVASLAITEWGFGGIGGMVLGVLAGGAVGAINGLLCGVLKLNPVVVTLGMLGAVRGGTLLVHHDQVFGLGGTVETIGNGDLLGVPTLGVIALVVFLLGGAFIRYTTWGRYVYAIGANRQAAFLAALPVRSLPFALYVVMGLAAGLAGVLLMARLNGVAPGDQGITLELQALTVVLLGGVAFDGGRGRMFGVFIGWIFLGVLENGLVITNVEPFVETLVQGLALVFAASLDQISNVIRTRVRQRERSARQLDDTPPGATRGPAETSVANPTG